MIELLLLLTTVTGTIVASIWILSKITVPILKALVSLIAIVIFVGIISLLGLTIFSMGIYSFIVVGFLIILIVINLIENFLD